MGAGSDRSTHRGLVAVCGTFVLVSVVLVPLPLPLGWDEIVYASRFGPYGHGPEVPFSAPRTRGVPLLLSPVASWSASVVLLRVWLVVLAGAALYLGFRPWLKVLERPAVVWIAAGLYGSVWITLFYADAAMPNHYAAMGACGAAGCFVRSRPAGIVAGLAVVTLMRPNDGAAVAAPLLLAAALVPRWRSASRVAAVVAGFVAGALPWVVEAYARFGGVRERLDRASETQGGMGLVFSLDDHLTALDGPLLCRPCAGDGVHLLVLEWWLLLPLLAGLGLWAARRTAALWAAVAVAVCSALPYLFLVPYAAARFLLPVYALLALPAAAGLLVAADRARSSRPAAAVLSSVLVGHLALQAVLAHSHAGIQERARGDWRLITEVLQDHGVRAPCELRGNSSAIPVAYTAGCRSAAMNAPGQPDAVLLRKARAPRWARDWPVFPVRGTYNPGWAVAVRP